MSLRPAIRMRLTAWFGGLVLVGGALLLGASYLLATHQIDAYPAKVNSLADSLAGVPPVRPQSGARGRALGQLPSRGQLERLSAQAAGERRARTTAEQQVSISTKRALFFELGGLLAAFALIAVATGFFATRRALAPVARITSAARRVGDGSLGERLRLDGPQDELKELGDTFDRMLDRVEQALERERAFIANASHELRTPLAIIRAEIDAARSGVRARGATTARSFEVIETAVVRSERLLESLFALARASRTVASPEPVDLRDLVEGVLRERQPALATRRLSVRTSLAPGSASGDVTLLHQLVENLLDNAVRHNRAGGELTVSTDGDDQWATLAIENDGTDLSAADVAHLTEPFARGSDASAGDQSGLGLGLTLAESIAQAHGGEMALTPRPPGGLRVVVRLPSGRASARSLPASSPREFNPRVDASWRDA
jgi:signal transduction histidine kinase